MKLGRGTKVTRVRPAPKDRHGDPTGDPDRRDLAQWGIDWNATYSNGQFRDVQTTDVDGYAPRADDVLPGDVIEIVDPRTGKVGSFHLLGRPMWDQVHPMSGRDFGYKLVRLREVTSG